MDISTAWRMVSAYRRYSSARSWYISATARRPEIRPSSAIRATSSARSSMTRSAMEATTVDLSVPSARIGDVLSELVREPAGPGVPVPPDIRIEVDIAAGERVDTEVLQRLGHPAALTCPSCGGVLSLMRNGKPLRLRCQVGHALTADSLAKQQENAVDEALRVALRVIEERAELVTRMAEEGRDSGRRAVAEMYEERAAEYRRYTDTTRRAVLMSLAPITPSDDEGGKGKFQRPPLPCRGGTFS